MPYLRPITQWMIKDEMAVEELSSHVDKYFKQNRYKPKDYYIILGKSYKKKLRQKRQNFLNLLRRTKRKAKQTLKRVLKILH